MSLLDIYGQDRALRQLQRARQAHRLAHGYIFHGPPGVGKGLLARQWAKSLLCPTPQTQPWDDAELTELTDACARCPDCHLVDVGNHPDLHIVNRRLGQFTDSGKTKKHLTLGIDVIRQFVIEQAGAFPDRRQGRVFIIEEAETMQREAQNALLKTLEEPPANTFLILLTTEVDRLLPTVQSRCQTVRFAPLPDTFVKSKLAETDLPAEQLGYWTCFCEGQLGVALEWAQLQTYEMQQQLAQRLAGLDYPQALELAGWINDQVKELQTRMTTEADTAAGSELTRRAQTHLLMMLAYVFRVALRQANGPEAVLTDGGGLDPKFVSHIGSRFGAMGCGRAIRATHQALRYLQANVNAGLLFESLVLNYIVYAA